MTPKELVTKHPHIFSLAEDGVLEMFCDHHMLSTMRTCEAKFYEEQLAHVGTKTQRYFSLEFGMWLHEALDKYYNAFKKTQNPPNLDEWTAWALRLWAKYDLDYFAPAPRTLTKDMYGDKKKYYALCNWNTKCAITGLLIQYYAFYMNQRMRVVDTEISFGKAREVPLGSFHLDYKGLYSNDDSEGYLELKPGFLVRCYLTGRIDLLVDNGNKIGPVDHKSTARFDGYESNDFDPHEGITGYIFAIDSILKANSESKMVALAGVPKICRDGWIYHISLADSEPRFKPTLVTKTPQQLDEYRKRQLKTCRRIYELATSCASLEDYGQIEFNANICNNIYNSPCPFRELHRQPFIQREGTINQFYEIKPAWNPAAPPIRKAKEEVKI